MNSSIIRLLLGTALLLGAPAVSTAAIYPDQYFRMGEDDGQPVPGPVTALKDSVGTSVASASFSGGLPLYSTAVSPEAAARTGSTACLDLLSGGRYLTSFSDWSLHWDACVELWVQPAAATGTAAIVSYGTGGNDGWSLMQIDGQFRARIGGAWFGSAPAIPGRWVHLAVVRDGDTGTLYADGVACGSAAVEDSRAGGLLTIGALPPACTTDFFRGRLDELRYSDHKRGLFDPAHDLLLHGPRLLVENGKDGTELGHRSTLALNAQQGYSAALTLHNTGSIAMEGIKVSITGIDASQFSLSPAIPASLTLGAGESTTFTVSLAASSRGISHGNLHIATSLSAPPFCDLALEGERPAPALAVSTDGQQIQQGKLFQPMTDLLGVPPSYITTPEVTDLLSVAVGEAHFLGLRNNGTVIAWGNNSAGQCNLPQPLTDIVQVAAGEAHSVALTKSGTMVSWGATGDIPPNLSGIKAICARGDRTAALRTNGTVQIWGTDTEQVFPQVRQQTGISAVSLSDHCVLLLKNDGTVTGWGPDYQGSITGLSGQTGITAIAAGDTGNVLVRKNGSVVLTGPTGTQLPSLQGVVAAAQSDLHTYLLQGNGVLVSFFNNNPRKIYGATPLLRSINAGPHYLGTIYDPGFTFPARTAPGESRTQTITLKSTGAQLLSVGKFTLTGPDAADFSIDRSGTKTFLDPRTGETTFQVIFHPQSAGLRRARLDIASNDPQRPVFSLALTGTCAVPPPQISIYRDTEPSSESQVDPAAVQEFRKTQNLTGSSEQTFTVRNDSAATIDGLNAVVMEVNGNYNGFEVDQPDKDSLAPGETAAFVVRFKPEFPGKYLVTGPCQASISLRSGATELAALTCSADLINSQESWRLAEFGTREATGDAANEADPDHDGIPNLLEYALNGDPLIAEDPANVLPQLTMQGDPAHPRPVLSFTYRTDRPGQALRVSATTDLVSGRWTEIAFEVDGRPFRVFGEGVQLEESAAGPLKGVRISVPAAGETGSAAPFRFMRLEAIDRW